MLLTIAEWFPAFKFAFCFGVVAVIVDALLKPKPQRRVLPPPVIEQAFEVDKAA